ncbi:MAG: hypothetical protein ACEQSX_20780, partial [Baekduiaceae bacterium]
MDRTTHACSSSDRHARPVTMHSARWNPPIAARNRVSDDDYWKDFSLIGNSGIQRLLNNDANLNWTDGTYSTG